MFLVSPWLLLRILFMLSTSPFLYRGLRVPTPLWSLRLFRQSPIIYPPVPWTFPLGIPQQKCPHWHHYFYSANMTFLGFFSIQELVAPSPVSPSWIQEFTASIGHSAVTQAKRLHLLSSSQTPQGLWPLSHWLFLIIGVIFSSNPFNHWNNLSKIWI